MEETKNYKWRLWRYLSKMSKEGHDMHVFGELVAANPAKLYISASLWLRALTEASASRKIMFFAALN